jgi:predicted CoA-binding protein
LRGFAVNNEKELVAILGASNKAERYSNKAQKALVDAGHEVIPVNPVFKEIDGVKVTAHLKDIHKKIDTLTLYVGPERLVPMIPDIIALNPSRIISNPGTECAEMKEAAEKAGIKYLEACTLVMLSTGQY